MKALKTLVSSVAIAMMMLCASTAHAQGRGETVLGVDLGYVSHNDMLKIGAFFQYGLADHLRIAPELSGYLRHDNTDAFVADVNVHFPMSITAMPCDIYPLVGLNFASWSHHLPLEVFHNTRVGANIGAGFEYYFKSNMKFNVELKYTFTRHYSTFVGSMGLAYVF